MFDTASGWLITSLDSNPIIVSLVQEVGKGATLHPRGDERGVIHELRG